MAALDVLNLKRAGNGVSLAGVAASGGGDTFQCNGREILVVKNGGGSPITVTVPTTETVDGLAVADLTATIAAGETRALGPFPPGIYSSTKAAGGDVALSYSGVTSVTVAVVRF